MQSSYSNSLTLLILEHFVCSECGMKFKTSLTLRIHADVHTDGIFQCPDCPAICKSQHRLRIHRQMHNNVRYKCSQCSSTFSLKAGLRRHTSELCYKKLKSSFNFNSDLNEFYYKFNI